MQKSVSDLKVDLQGALHGTNLNRVQGLDQVIYRAAGDLLLDIDPQETIRLDALTGATYDSDEDVYTYELPEDLKGISVIYFSPNTDNGTSNITNARYSKDFDVRHEKNTFTIDFADGVKILRLSTNSAATSWDIGYYSKYLFRDGTSGDWQETVTADTDLINLDTESYNLLLDRVMILLAPQLQGKDSGFDLTFYQKHYDEGRKRYSSRYKSQVEKPQSIYYRQPFKPTRY
jgi:hypothetical protein